MTVKQADGIDMTLREVDEHRRALLKELDALKEQEEKIEKEIAEGRGELAALNKLVRDGEIDLDEDFGAFQIRNQRALFLAERLKGLSAELHYQQHVKRQELARDLHATNARCFSRRAEIAAEKLRKAMLDEFFKVLGLTYLASAHTPNLAHAVNWIFQLQTVENRAKFQDALDRMKRETLPEQYE